MIVYQLVVSSYRSDQTAFVFACLMGRKFNDRNIIATLLVTPLSWNAGCSNERAKSIVARLSFIGIPLFFFFSLSFSLSLFHTKLNGKNHLRSVFACLSLY